MAFLLLVVDHLHQIVKLVLALEFLLARLHLLVRLSVEDVGLGAQRLSQFVDLEGEGNKVLLLSVEHVVADVFGQRLEQVRLFQEV